jgi:tRNA threonylcarbamoyladenosine biosynthesis protein TsaE
MEKYRIEKTDLGMVAQKLITLCEKSDSAWAVVIALQGDLGTGKTTLTKDIAYKLGIKSDITSPTFVIEKIYGLPKNKNSRFDRLVHIDAYRLNRSEELDAIGWHDVVNDPKNLILIEWPENVEKALPKNVVKVNLKHVNETTREISW